MREWMKLGLAAAACGILAGCTSGHGAQVFVDRLPLPEDTMTVAMEQAGVHGGRFVSGATTSPKTFNPIMSNETSSNEIISQIFVSLTDIDYLTQADIPSLARSWDLSPDGRTVTYHLRRGARFSDGHPITSKDVEFCFDVCMDPQLHPSMQDGLVMTVNGKSVPYTYSAPDSQTFVVTSPLPDALILAHVANVRILPRHVLEPAFRAGTFASAYNTATRPESLVTSGPFKLEHYVANERTVLTRNPYWYGVDAQGQRLPYLDQVVFLVAPDQAAAALKFHAGELDGLDNVKPEDYTTFANEQKSRNFTLYDVGPSFNSSFFFFNLNRVRTAGNGKKVGDPQAEPYKYAWFSNRDFRRAISMAIDRDALVRGVYSGNAAKGWSIMMPNNPRWYDSTITAADYDPDGAKKLLDRLGLVDRNGDGVREDAAGHPVSFTLLYNSDNKLRADVAAFLKDDLAKVGVRETPQGLDFNTLLSKTRNDFQYEACLLGLGSSVPADPGMGPNFWKSTGATHYWDLKQPAGRPDTPAEAKMDRLFDENLSTVDLAHRKATYREMSQVMNDEYFVIWLPTPVLRVPVSNKFGNIHPSPMPPRILWNADRIFMKPGNPS